MTEMLQMRKQTSWRLRLSVVVCMLLLLFAGTAEVAHTHPGDLALGKSLQNSPVQPARNAATLCPLCIAMHSTMPVAPHVVVMPAELARTNRAVPAASKYVLLWRFELFGRPPPAPVGV
jgi:hypothetical protein